MAARTTRNAVTIVEQNVLKQDPARLARVDQLYSDKLIGMALTDLRLAAGLTQAELAQRIGTSPSTISRLEDAEYEGHSFAMLRRVSRALGKRIEIRFVDVQERGEEAVEQELSLAR